MIAQSIAIDFPDPTISETISWLCQNLMDDPVLALSSAFAWLDPGAFEENKPQPVDYDWPDEEREVVPIMLEIARDHFVSGYVDMVDALHATSMLSEQSRTLLGILADETPFELDTFYAIDMIASGYVPHDAYGVHLYDEEWLDIYDDYLPILDALGVTEPRSIEAPDRHVAKHLHHSLKQQGGRVYDNLSVLIKWLFSNTGNTLADFTHDEIIENGYDYYTWSDYEFVAYIQIEAQTLLDQAVAGRDALQRDPLLLHALRCNVQHVQRLLPFTQKFTYRHGTGAEPYDDFIPLEWPDYTPVGGPGNRPAFDDNQLLSFWRDAAETNRKRRHDGVSG